jgi:hypothetical protein
MISDEELTAIEARQQLTLTDGESAAGELAAETILNTDVPALLKDARELRDALQTASGALADIAHMTDRERAEDVPRKKAQRIYDSLPKL